MQQLQPKCTGGILRVLCSLRAYGIVPAPSVWGGNWNKEVIMKRTLLVTSALAFAGALAVGQASAAEKMSVGVGGYMQQWVGMADINGHATREGGLNVVSDAEVYFKGTLAADSGLTFTVDIQLEGNNAAGNYIDESFLKITGDFGDVRIGSEDPVISLMHYGHQDVGVGLIAGDTQQWLGHGHYLNTYGSFTDALGIVYFTPRMQGVQLGVSYNPDSRAAQAANNKAPNNDLDIVAVGMNYKGAVGDSSVAFSVAHYVAATQGDDDATKTNIGLQVGMGAFGFNVAYAEEEDGMDADTEDDIETMSVGAKYSDGPMAVSIGFAQADRGNDTDTSAFMLSASYALAPGVDWKSSMFSAEEGDIDGTAFVTGFTVGF